MDSEKSKYNTSLEVYKNLHDGKEAVVLCTGQSLNNYKPITGDIVVGVNRIYNYPELLKSLDYYFFGSGYETDSAHKININSIDERIQKFASAYRDGASTGYGNITPEHATAINAIPFECGLINFTNNISEYKILGHSIIFPAMQFLLYTGVKKIYVVGCDIVGFYDSGNENHLKEWWDKFKAWVTEAYPKIEIVVVNPVGLKGMFIDHEQN